MNKMLFEDVNNNIKVAISALIRDAVTRMLMEGKDDYRSVFYMSENNDLRVAVRIEGTGIGGDINTVYWRQDADYIKVALTRLLSFTHIEIGENLSIEEPYDKYSEMQIYIDIYIKEEF